MKKTLNKVFAFCMAIAMCVCTCLSTPALAMGNETAENEELSTSALLDQVTFLGSNGKPLDGSGADKIVLTRRTTKVGYRILPYQGQPTGYTVSLTAYESGTDWQYQTVWADGQYHELSGTFNFEKGDTVLVRYAASQVKLASIVVIFG